MFWLHLPTYLRTLCHGDSGLGYKISLWDKPLCLAVGVRNAFWDTKRRALAGVALQQTRRAKERTCPELSGVSSALRSRQLHPPPRQDLCQERPCLLTRRQHLRLNTTMVCPPVICRSVRFRQPPVIPSRWHRQH